MTATIHCIAAKRAQTQYSPVEYTGMTPVQYSKRQDMEASGWTFKKMTKIGDAVMEFGVIKMAFIDPLGDVQVYRMESLK